MIRDLPVLTTCVQRFLVVVLRWARRLRWVRRGVSGLGVEQSEASLLRGMLDGLAKVSGWIATARLFGQRVLPLLLRARALPAAWDW